MLLSGMLPIFQNLSYKLQKRLSDVLPCPSTEVHEDKLCNTLKGMALTNDKMVHQISFLYIESNPDRLGLLSPTQEPSQTNYNNTSFTTNIAVNW